MNTTTRHDPFDIEGPAVISFSAGRTSAFMLRQVLDRGLRPNVHVLFADVGRERAETYRFALDVERHWKVPVTWVARGYGAQLVVLTQEQKEARAAGAPVHIDGALFNPFDLILQDRAYLPGPALRFCTTEMKVRPMKKFMLAQGYKQWDMVIGVRADEEKRVRKLRVKPPERWENNLPLADAGVVESDVLRFWARQPFDLQLQPYEGNCDGCHLKRDEKLIAIFRTHPELADKWIEDEARTGKQFKPCGVPYAMLKAEALLQNSEGTSMPTLRQLGYAYDDITDCLCGD